MTPKTIGKLTVAIGVDGAEFGYDGHKADIYYTRVGNENQCHLIKVPCLGIIESRLYVNGRCHRTIVDVINNTVEQIPG